jgi:putative FmdB family regulatory protein
MAVHETLNQHVFQQGFIVPIYAYKCSACGHAKDVLQKLSDQPLTVCPACGQSTYSKQVTAAGFQLKGSGWYVTDFRNSGGGTAKTSEPSPSTSAAPSGDAGAAQSPPAAAAAPDSGSSGASAPATPSTSA